MGAQMCSEESISNRCINDEHIRLPFLDLQEGLSSKNNGYERPSRKKKKKKTLPRRTRLADCLIPQLTAVTDLNSLSHM